MLQKKVLVSLVLLYICNIVTFFSILIYKNKEIKAFLIDAGYYTPSNAIDLIRYIYYKKTGSTLLISSKYNKQDFNVNSYRYNSSELLASFAENYGVETIARTFNRYRDFWIMLKKDSKANAKIPNNFFIIFI